MSLFNRNCREVTRLLLEAKERRLSIAERVGVRLHLRICLMCVRFTGQVQLMDRAMAQWKAYAEQDDGAGTP
ncbi:MAG TPA: zf-HC2 domain-containing protein [Burkholderiaceae bacterium]